MRSNNLDRVLIEQHRELQVQVLKQELNCSSSDYSLVETEVNAE
jgi:hypothetical protein